MSLISLPTDKEFVIMMAVVGQSPEKAKFYYGLDLGKNPDLRNSSVMNAVVRKTMERFNVSWSVATNYYLNYVRMVENEGAPTEPMEEQRQCSKCKSETTYAYNGHPAWHRSGENLLCHRCYTRKYHEEHPQAKSPKKLKLSGRK